ncbi:MAG: oligopeptide transporter, OPT family, partial [Myxococcales bacterium]|nr:oligopeptide transporter, OPT family [Myxococcales bacterium]
MQDLTPRAVVIGLALSVVMGAANVYLGLYAGMTVSASIPAAVVGLLILRIFFRGGTIGEANMIQTSASSGEALAAGIIFTVPALLLIGAWKEFDMVTTAIIGMAGGLLGVLFMIPMRRVFVTENNDLPYPEGVACAMVLEANTRTGDDATSKRDGRLVIVGSVIGGLWKLIGGYFGVFLGTLEGATRIAGRLLFFGGDMSPALLGVGFIVGLEVALLVFAGGVIAWLVCIPFLPEISSVLNALHPGWGAYDVPSGSALDQAWELWSTRIRYVGVGAMVVGGVSSIVKVRHGLVRAVKELGAGFQGRTEETDEMNRDLPASGLVALAVFATLLVGYAYYQWTHHAAITLVTTLVMLVLSFFFVAVASYIVGLVGNSNSPVSGMTITAVLFAGAFLLLLGFSGEEGMLATLGVATIVCCAASTSGDMCNDLKTGQLVGAPPRKQQLMQIGGVVVASLVMAPVLQMLHHAYGVGSKALPAPQAALFASLVKGLFGDGHLPWGFVALGAVLGGAILLTDAALERRGAKVRVHLMPVAVGMYLP